MSMYPVRDSGIKKKAQKGCISNGVYAVASSGGKDSTHALYQAQKRGLNVRWLLHLYNPDNSRIRFHGYRKEVIIRQAKTVGLEQLVMPARWDNYDEDFKRALKKLKQRGVEGLIFGEINPVRDSKDGEKVQKDGISNEVNLEDCRKYNERMVKQEGLKYYAPLWKIPPGAVLEKFIKQGFKAVVCSVWEKLLNKKYLGREINEEFLKDISKEKNVDVCGENGEYHSLVYDGPCFKEPLSYKIHGVHQEKENVFLDIR